MFNVKDELTPGEKFYNKKRRTTSNLQFVSSAKRIMIVDDEVFNIYAIQGLMQVLGMPNELQNVDVCYNGEQAVELVRKAIQEKDADRYSLILTDCSMPFMDGY
jgi:CheY-like chemotaxis protein